MSSDNGIYILRTLTKDGKGFEFRVAERGAIDNLYYFDKTGDLLSMWDYFHDCPVIKNHDMAFEKAIEIGKDYGYTEYGICMKEIDKVFPETKPKCPDHGLTDYQSDDVCMRCGEKVKEN